MTTLERPEDRVIDEVVILGEVPPRARPRWSLRGLSPRERRTIAIGVGAVIVGVLLTLMLLEGPVAQLMYSQRQRERTAQYLDAAGAARIERGDALAVLQAPAIGLNVAVVEGDDAQELRGGPGHRIGTPLPGQTGNSVIAGRRNSFGAPFERLDELTPGMLISVQVRASLSAVDYLVREVRRVPEHDVSALQSQDEGQVLTLVTSDGGRFSQERLVVVADYDAGLPLAPRVGADEPSPELAFGGAAPTPAPSPGESEDGRADAVVGGFDTGVTFLGVTVLMVWIGVIVTLIVGVGRLRERFPTWLTAVVLTPVFGAAVLQLWFALDAMGPATR